MGNEVTPAILVVDDHPANLTALEAALRPLGHPIVTAASGAEALSRLGERNIVLILMDVHMPGLDGYQTTRLIRDRPKWRDIPIIFLTAVFNSPEHAHRGYAMGAVDYITKPFDEVVLLAKVRALVALYTRGELAERERGAETQRMKDLFLGAVGHDLRNPLNAILLGAQMILAGDACAVPAHRTDARRIERAARRMQRMIEDILDLTRRELADGIPVSRRPTDLALVCATVADETRRAYPGRDVALEAPASVWGEWDPDRIHRVVANLVSNAMEHGGESPVRVLVAERRGWASLEVHNRGAPIAPHILPTLFEPFRRGSANSNGLGLGLYIVREIVRAHGGTVDVASSAEQGTTFSVALPSAPPETVQST